MIGQKGARTLRDVLVGHAEAQSGHILLISPETGAKLTYGDLEREARAVAAQLRARGLLRGDKVALFMENGYQSSLLFLASMIGGYVITPINLLANRAQLAFVIDQSDSKIVFTSGGQFARVREALADVNRTVHVQVIDPNNSAPREGPGRKLEPVAEIDPALLMYTSGTTGMPKGVLLTHANLLAAARNVAMWHELTSDDRVLSALPIYHINGQVIGTLASFVAGGSIVVPQRFSVSSWWQDVERFKPTWINLVPTMIAYLLHAAKGKPKQTYRTVRFGRSASAPLPRADHIAFENTFEIPVIEGMGMTEAASVVFCNPQDAALRKYGSPGVPCGVEAKIVMPNDPECAPLADGERGEIMLRGPNVMLGYYKAPELTRKALEADGWLHTGDLGYRDADGYYFIVGRLKELIIKGGENIAPREIDETLLQHPAVLEAAAVGIPDLTYGEDILACVVLKAGMVCSEDELRSFCLRELGRYKTPKLFRFVDDLPKGPSGKVQRLKLTERANY